VLCSTKPGEREIVANRVLKEKGGTLIPPYDHYDVIAGQGTIALEFLEQCPNLEALIVPVGGGGMLSGICITAKSLNPNIRIFAAEPKAADDAYKSLIAGKVIPLESAPDTIADGLRTSLGELTFPIIHKYVERVITVTELEILNAMKLVWERMKLVIEPSAGVGVAVALSSEFKAIKDIKRVGIILCGGNVDLENWSFSNMYNRLNPKL